MIEKIGFGGGCHWCTEAYFQSLKGVEKVEQGWISSTLPNDSFSEAVIVDYNPFVIPLKILIGIHLHTHSATNNHRFREKYRSAVYVFNGKTAEADKLIAAYQIDFDAQLITRALVFDQFKINNEQQQDYYKKNKDGIFCERYIDPKLQLIATEYAGYFKGI